MQLWWESLGTVGQVFACIAIPATLILVIQTLLTLFGLGGNSDMDDGSLADTPGDIDGMPDGVFGEDIAGDGMSQPDIAGMSDFKMFTFRGIVAFFVIFGWMGIVLVRSGVGTALTFIISIIAGLAAMVLVALLMRAFYRLQYDGSENIRNALGASGSVYLAIPPSRTGTGKITFMLQGSYVEREAVTDDETALPYGTQVTVIGVIGGSVLLVKRK